MAKRRRTNRRFSVPVVEQPSLTPDSGLRITLKQAAVAIAVILGAGAAYGSIVWTQSVQSADIKIIKDAQTASTSVLTNATQQQDDRRAALGKAFLDSNEKIVGKLGDLTTQLAVQQAKQIAADEKLGKVLDQIGNALQQPAPALRLQR